MTEEADPDALTDTAIGNVMRVQDRFKSGDPKKMRAVLNETIDRIDLTFTRKGRQNRLKEGSLFFVR